MHCTRLLVANTTDTTSCMLCTVSGYSLQTQLIRQAVCCALYQASLCKEQLRQLPQSALCSLLYGGPVAAKYNRCSNVCVVLHTRPAKSLQTQWGGSKGVINFPWIFCAMRSSVPVEHFREYIRALIHLTCLHVTGYCLPTVSCEMTRTKWLVLKDHTGST